MRRPPPPTASIAVALTVQLAPVSLGSGVELGRLDRRVLEELDSVPAGAVAEVIVGSRNITTADALHLIRAASARGVDVRIVADSLKTCRVWADARNGIGGPW